ncbi:hypothetical protein Xmau_00920 [Xenorhabdus mauleonii]|uniref:Pvc16 N-terminal domain-containing protein n=1 Tax=Xenorhabdus mauleonii TaxID=351675 RepID=A0A1I3LQF5_9GAMM|nr:hypothetical protein Xmau_00920 [Xenorhabdus mauleonii]SFI86978.1 Protein of unknown function [Xenorhabdus mauleonii]
MATVVTSNNIIIEVNKALNKIFSRHLNKESIYLSNDNEFDFLDSQKKEIDEGEVNIRFDLPEVNSIQSKPTISVFLYDISEDLQLRTAESRRYNAATNTLLPGWVNINCNYLITYWDTNSPSNSGMGPDSQPDNQAAKIMTRVLSALINNRQLEGIPGAYTRVIPQQENLNSLGSFWQALGNRPRLSLLYSITVPMRLENIENKVVKVEKDLISASFEEK